MAFFCAKNMELFSLLFSLWALASVCLALIWYIVQQSSVMAQEREKNRELIMSILTTAESERKDLYDRLQAGTLPQYKDYQGEPNNVEDDLEDEPEELEDAKEDLMNG